MNRLLTLILIIPVLLLCACDPEEPRDASKESKATLEDIQGTWTATYNAYYYTVTFNKTAYMIEVVNTFSEDPLGTVSGIFVYDDAKLTLEPQYSFGNEINVTALEVYWADKSKTTLNIFPLGTFVRQ